MYKYLGLALVGVFAMMVIPAQVQLDYTNPTFYGMATLTVQDATGNEVFQQSIHNQLSDEGEAFILNQVFQEGATIVPENESIGAICVSIAPRFTTGGHENETSTAVGFDANDELTAANCVEDTAVDDTATPSKAVVNSANAFDENNLDAVGETITGIAICQARSADNLDFANCVSGGSGSGGIALALVDISDVTLNSGETVDITYTFDITSDST